MGWSSFGREDRAWATGVFATVDVRIFKFGKILQLLFGISLTGCIILQKGDVGYLVAVLFGLIVLVAPSVAWESLFLATNSIPFNVSHAFIKTLSQILILLGAVFLLVGVEEARVGALFVPYTILTGVFGVCLDRRYPETGRLCRGIVSARERAKSPEKTKN